MRWILLSLLLLSLVVDRWYFRRHGSTFRHRNTVRALVVAVDLLPFAILALLWLVRDNPTGLIQVAMWTLFGYLLLTLPRMIYYAVRITATAHGANPRPAAAAAAACT